VKTLFIQLCQSDIRVRYHKSIYKAPQYLLESAQKAISEMPSSFGKHYLESHPPKFRKNSPYHWLVGNHFTYSMIKVLEPDELFWALIYEANAYPDELVAEHSVSDQWDLEGLLKNNERPSKPVQIKLRRIESGQFCLLCDRDRNMKIALVGPNNAAHVAKEQKEAIIKCPNCDRKFPVTPQQLLAFNNYTLTGAELIPFCTSP
jgi:transcription elongation factor Elf1